MDEVNYGREEMSQYSRSKQSSDKGKKDAKLVPVKQIKTGFSALQKTIALVGSIMSILVATITINRYLNENSSPKTEDKPAETKVIYQNNDIGNQTTIAETVTTVGELSEYISVSSETVETSVADTTVVQEVVTEIESPSFVPIEEIVSNQ